MFPDGYGICYNPQEEKFFFSISTFRHHPETDASKFGLILIESLREMRSTLDLSISKAKL